MRAQDNFLKPLMEILPQLIVNAIITGSMYALASAGLALTYGLLRILNFAHGQLLMIGAYLFYYFYEELHLSLLPASFATCLSTIVLALMTLRIFVLPFLRFNYMLPILTTLSLATILESIASMRFGVNVKSYSVVTNLSGLEFFGIYITPVQIFIIASTILILSTLAFLVHSTSIGRKMRALAEAPHAAQALGINNTQTNRRVFAGATILCVFAGIMVGLEINLQPTMGGVYTIKAFAAMILGGLGNVWGTIAGAYILGFVENLCIGLDFGSYSIPAGYKDAFAYMIILLVLLFRPQGLFTRKARVA